MIATQDATNHTRASVKESKGYPPPEKFWIAAPPPQEGDSLAKYSPLLEKFEPKIQKIVLQCQNSPLQKAKLVLR